MNNIKSPPFVLSFVEGLSKGFSGILLDYLPWEWTLKIRFFSRAILFLILASALARAMEPR